MSAHLQRTISLEIFLADKLNMETQLTRLKVLFGIHEEKVDFALFMWIVWSRRKKCWIAWYVKKTPEQNWSHTENIFL